MRCRRLLLAGLLMLLPGCLRLRWAAQSRNEPITEANLEQLRPASSSLGDCLDRLGAPDLVFEYQGDGVALGYGWRDAVDWGFTASYTPPNTSGGSVSFSFDSSDADLPGVILLFDEQLELRSIERGFLRDLTLQVRPPSSPAEES